jgi:hypothetical protein
VRWEYLITLVVLVLLAILFFVGGRLSAKDNATRERQLGYDEGYRQGRDDEKEAWIQPEKYADTFRERRVQANRRGMPRPDSAGPIRTHRAVVRGDHRLPQNQDEKGNRTNPNQRPQRTKLSPTIDPVGDEWNGS